MATTEIEKLERRYAENPQGLTFAPLAEVHRKNGDIGRALELLKSGLELHPNYIPASIVLGRCHLDQGDLPAAESAFAHVLRLDDENVIALKSLAEISERLGRAGEAQRWLKRLISIDRSNEEARQHLARLEGAKADPVASAQVPAAASPPAPTPPTPRLPAELPPTPVAETKASPEVPRSAPEESPALDLTAAIADPAPAAATSEVLEQAPPPSPALDFLDTAEPAPRIEAAADAGDRSPAQEQAFTDKEPAPVDGLISQEFVPPREGGYRLHPELTPDFAAATDSLEQLEVETAAEVELQSSGASEFRVPNAAEDFEDFMEATAPPPAPPPPVPTPAPTLVRPSLSVRETGGRSVAAFFQALLSARPAGAASSSARDGKAPGISAQELSQAPGAAADETSPNPPTIPAAAPSQDANVTFDDFFGAPAGGSGAPKEGGDAGEDDLDQFQSWLQNLKR